MFYIKSQKQKYQTTQDFFDNALDDAFDAFDDIFSSINNTGFPPYNIISIDENNYVIELAVAGFKKDEIIIKLNDTTLLISGKKEKTNKSTKYISHGIAYRDFVRTFTLSQDIVVNEATHEDGLLKITLSRVKLENKKSNLIPIK